jgi:hypothetical protein
MKKTRLDGRLAKNPSEVKCYEHLNKILPSDLCVTYEDTYLTYTITGRYNPDFRISYRRDDGTLCFLEYKGNGRAFDHKVRQKMIAVKEQNPDVKIYIVFHSDGKIGPTRRDGSFLRQSDWAKKNGFEFCIGTQNIPLTWFQ